MAKKVQLFGGPCDGQKCKPPTDAQGVVQGLGKGKTAIYIWDRKVQRFTYRETLNTDDTDEIMEHMRKIYYQGGKKHG